MIDYKDQKYKVVIVTPAGREKFLSISKKFIYRKMEEGLIDGWQLWLNTVKESDIKYLESMEKENPKVKVYRLDEPIVPTWDNYNALQTHKFFKFAQDNDTIYVRFDDDLIWTEEGALEKLLQARINAPRALLIYPNVINSTIVSYWHQQIMALGTEAGKCNGEYLDEFAYANSDFIELIHKTFKKRYEENSLSAYYLPNRLFENWQHFSICCIAFWGKDKLQPTELEEAWLSWEEPERKRRPVFFCGDALMVHYNYHTQKDYLMTLKPQPLEFFKQITK